MAQSPEELRRDIAGTREDLGRDVDMLNEKIAPRNVMNRQVDKAKGGIMGLKDKVMGSTPSPSSVRDSAGSATSSIGDAASSAGSAVGDTMSSGVQTARSRTEGNPLAAGMIAFAAGWLVSSLIPASRAEEQLAQQAQDKAADLAEPLKEEAKQAGMQLKEGLQGPAQEAAETVKASATSAAQTVADEGRSAAEDMKDEGQTSVENVRSSSSGS